MKETGLSGKLPEFPNKTRGCDSESPLPNLTYLDLSYNKLSGKLPEWIGQLQNLVDLHLSHNFLQGTNLTFSMVKSHIVEYYFFQHAIINKNKFYLLFSTISVC